MGAQTAETELSWADPLNGGSRSSNSAMVGGRERFPHVMPHRQACGLTMAGAEPKSAAPEPDEPLETRSLNGALADRMRNFFAKRLTVLVTKP